MSTAFTIVNASRKLEKYLSREYYNLDRMSENERIPASLLETKVGQYNELVDTLNELFAFLTHSGQPLFRRYGSSEEIFPIVVVPHEENRDTSPNVPVVDTTADETEEVESAPEQDVPETAEEEKPIWQIEGYSSYEEWCTDKEIERVEVRDDLSVGVNPYLSQYQAGKVLREYQEAQAQDITTYNPEEDVPVSVLPQEHVAQGGSLRPTEDLSYLNHTADGTLVDRDPTQIAKVQTAVERDYENAGKGADIDVSSFIYQSEKTVINHFIDDDISKLHVAREEDVQETEDDVEES